MSKNNLDQLFNPESVAVIGASDREGSVGATLMGNLTEGFSGQVLPVNPKHDKVMGLDCFASIADLPDTPDLAVIATPAATVLEVVDACGKKGIRSAVIISAGFGETGKGGKEAERELDAKRREHGMRIVGPNCLGIIRPSLGLNLTFLRKRPQEGGIAFFSQSGAMGAAILDWAAKSNVGFSAFVSVGNMLDVDFGDLIDYFGNDRHTSSIIMYMESVTDAAKFMSAARAFARNKPLLVIKAGKHERSAEAVASHTGSLAGQDDVYEAAFKRSGVTRVQTVDDLFTCSELLAKQPLPSGPRVCVITNAGGPGILTADAILDHGGSLADLSDKTGERLQDVLPPHAGKGNPVDVLGDADAERYREAGKICSADDGVDGLVIVYSPQGEASAEDAAQAVVDVAEGTDKPVITSWMGGAEVAEARRLLQSHEVPTVATPEEAVRGYLALHSYARNLELLYETPEELPVDSIPPRNHLKVLLGQIAEDGRDILTETEAKKLLDVYAIPVSETKIAEDAAQAGAMAEKLGFPVVLKVLSPDITHKSDVGGVLLHITSAEDAGEGFKSIRRRVEEHDSSARFPGVTVQKMVENIDYELIIGAKRDPVFGPVIVFGRGGTGVELYRDTAVGFPPLNQTLARRMMEETKVYQLLQGYRGASPANLRLLEEHLVRFSQLVIDFPEIREIDINPLAVVDGEFIALDARIVIDRDCVREPPRPLSHLVIEPYPRRYEETWQMDGQDITLRPIRPEDEPLEFDLFDTFSEETWRQRFFGSRRDVSHQEMTRYTNIDYRRTMAIVGILDENKAKRMIGVARLIIDPTTNTAEYAIVLGDPWQGKGLGEKLTDKIIGIANEKGVEVMEATVLKDNQRMLELCRKMGFTEKSQDDGTVELDLRL